MLCSVAKKLKEAALFLPQSTLFTQDSYSPKVPFVDKFFLYLAYYPSHSLLTVFLLTQGLGEVECQTSNTIFHAAWW